jgi:hypothetical protein
VPRPGGGCRPGMHKLSGDLGDKRAEPLPLASFASDELQSPAFVVRALLL